MKNATEQGSPLAPMELRAREVFDASVDSLDAHMRSSLNQARQAATAALERSHASPWRRWVPAGAFAAAALVAVLVWRAPGTGQAPQQQVQASGAPAGVVEVLAAGDDLDLATEDLAFYEWAAQETAASGNDVS